MYSCYGFLIIVEYSLDVHFTETYHDDDIFTNVQISLQSIKYQSTTKTISLFLNFNNVI